MSTSSTLRGLIEKRGASRTVDGHITACTASRDNMRFAFTTAEGDVIIAHRADLREPASWATYAVHDGAALALAPDTDPSGFLTGGDDGRLCRLDMHGEVEELGKTRRWLSISPRMLTPRQPTSPARQASRLSCGTAGARPC